MIKRPFGEIRLGKTSAEKESLEFPELLTDGFFDPGTFIERAKGKHYFLFLGHKGSGKSAIGEHLRLTAEIEPNLFVKYISLGDFPYTSFSKIIKGDLEPEAKYPDAWSWLLLLQIIEQFAQDLGSSLHTHGDSVTAYSELRQAGLLPATSLKHIVQQTTKVNGGIDWKAIKLGREKTDTHGSPAEIPFFVEKMKNIVFSISSESQHILVIDGLDELLGKRKVQLETLASLVYEVDRLNASFQRNSSPIKILLLCRTDIYEKLPNANKNKIRQDAAVELVWFSDPTHPENSNLVRLANHRASSSVNEPIDIFSDYFPESIFVHDKQQDVRSFLLDFTRHTPRDFISLLNYIQKEISRDGYLGESEIHKGIKTYSTNYFLPEIRDELNGYLDPDEIDGLIAVLSALGKREFTMQQLTTCASGFSKTPEVDLYSSMGHLFECSALGMIESGSGQNFFTIKYRNRNAILDFSKRLIVHKGLARALNLR